MKKFIIIFLLVNSCVPFAYAADSIIKNAGFVPANIWYSKDPFFSGDKIRVYTILFNGSAYDLEGVVKFFDNGVSIGETNFSISGGGRVRDIWIDWESKEGKHTITARITGATASLAGGVKRPIILDNIETGVSDRMVDFDTDGDGIGNNEDLDDDNDGVSDVDELRNGTDPLKKDTNGNGISDGKELENLTKQKLETEKILAARGMSSSSESGGLSVGTILDTIKKVDGAIPSSVKISMNVGTNALERFRVGEGYQVRLAKEEKSREINTIKMQPVSQKSGDVLGTVSSIAEKPFAYVMLGALTALQYFLEWQVIFYGVILYLIYRIVKWAFGCIRDR